MTDIITIDGPAASGKGTIARKLADHLGYFYLDTGAIYRLIGLTLIERGVVPEEEPETAVAVAKDIAKDFDPASLNNPDLKRDDVGQMASRSGAIAEVRSAILDLQRTLADHPPHGQAGSVLDGRDCGTVIYPQAAHKFFITADVEVRAKRRLSELQKRGDEADYAVVLTDMRQRDERDTARTIAPTLPAPDATIIDTSDMDVDALFGEIINQLK